MYQKYCGISGKREKALFRQLVDADCPEATTNEIRNVVNAQRAAIEYEEARTPALCKSQAVKAVVGY